MNGRTWVAVLVILATAACKKPGPHGDAQPICDAVATQWATLMPIEVVRGDVDTIPASDTVARLACLIAGRVRSSKAAPMGDTYWSPYYAAGAKTDAPPDWERLGLYDADGPGTLDRTYARIGVRCQVSFESDAGSDNTPAKARSDTVTERTICWPTDESSLGRAQPRAVAVGAAPCGTTVSAPPGWEAQPLDSGTYHSPCAMRLSPPHLDDILAKSRGIDFVSVIVIGHAEGLDSALVHHGFEQDSGSWVVLGRDGARSAAHEITGAGWRGQQGLVSIACVDRKGSPAGMCEQPTALVGTSARSVFVQGGPRSEREFERVLRSVRIASGR
jgi:hypothetical protein